MTVVVATTSRIPSAKHSIVTNIISHVYKLRDANTACTAAKVATHVIFAKARHTVVDFSMLSSFFGFRFLTGGYVEIRNYDVAVLQKRPTTQNNKIRRQLFLFTRSFQNSVEQSKVAIQDFFGTLNLEWTEAKVL